MHTLFMDHSAPAAGTSDFEPSFLSSSAEPPRKLFFLWVARIYTLVLPITSILCLSTFDVTRNVEAGEPTRSW